MNAFCVICSDHFVSLTEIDISAGTCGHTFHAACLEKWLQMSRTCPTCRQHWTKRDVISKLFFETSKVELDEEECTPKLLNELSTIRVRLAESERKSSQLNGDFQALRESNDLLAKTYEESQNKMQALLEASKAKNRQIKFYQNCEKEWSARDNEHKELKSKVQKYSYIENLVKVSEAESKLLLEKAAEGPGAVDRLVSMCAIIKREYEQAKRNKKSQRNELDKVIKELASLRVELDKVKYDNVVVREQKERAEKELTESERQLLEMKKRYNSLIQNSSSPCLNNSQKNNGHKQKSDFLVDDETYLDDIVTTPNLYDRCNPRILTLSPGDRVTSPRSASSNDGKINQIAIKITTAATSSKLSRKSPNESSSRALGEPKFSTFKTADKPVIQNFRKGYDGLGGHTSFTQTLFRQNLPQSSKKRPLRNSDHSVFPFKRTHFT